ncbi:MAG: glycosyltransferase family 4 protein [Thermotogota bacterium]|nr:glycosyltransferase family 4 protein [Thermotogota bacterium]
MRILFLHSVPLRGSGSGTYVCNLAENLVERHNLLVLYPGKALNESFPVKNIAVNPVPVFTSHPIVKSRSIINYSTSELIDIISLYDNELKEVLKEFSPDIIHVQHFGLWLCIPSLRKMSEKVPVVATGHGTGLYVTENDRRIYNLVKETTGRISKVIAVSDYVKNKVEKLFPDLNNKIKTITGGVDIKKFEKARVTKSKWRKKHKLKDKVVLYVGRLIKEKGVQHMINISRHFPRTSFVITGSGDYKDVVFDSSKEQENVLILPHLDDEIIDFFIYSDILCVPSIWKEALGLVILEAMASKTAVVASNIGGIPSVVEHSETGLLFEPGNEKDLREKISLILNNPDLSKHLTAKAYDLIIENFTWKNISEQIESVYYELTGK